MRTKRTFLFCNIYQFACLSNDIHWPEVGGTCGIGVTFFLCASMCSNNQNLLADYRCTWKTNLKSHPLCKSSTSAWLASRVSGGSRPLQTGVQIASLACQCCVLVYHIVVSLYVWLWGHTDLPDTASSRKKLSLLQREKFGCRRQNFFRDVIGVKMGIGLNKMQINSIVICINFIDNSIHVCSLSAQPPHTLLIVNATTATCKTVWDLKLICTPHACPTWYTTHIHCTCRFSAIFRAMETSNGVHGR